MVRKQVDAVSCGGKEIGSSQTVRGCQKCLDVLADGSRIELRPRDAAVGRAENPGIACACKKCVTKGRHACDSSRNAGNPLYPVLPIIRRPEQTAGSSCKKIGPMDRQTHGGAAVRAVDFRPLSMQRLRHRNEHKKHIAK